MKLKVLTFSTLLAFLIFSCKNDDVNPETESDNNPEDVLASLEEMEAASDYIWSESEAKSISLNGTSASISGTGATISGSKITITAAGTYKVSGTLTNGQIKVQTDDSNPVKIVLNGANITNNDNPALFIDKSKKTILILADGTNNSLSDGTTFSNTDEGQNAALYAQSYLAISGNGNLNVNGNYLDGIGAKDGLLINNGNITVKAKDDGIRGKDFLVIRKGSFNITSGGDGLKSDNEDDSSFGYVLIQNGDFVVNSTGDAVSAQTKVWVTDGSFKLTTSNGSNQKSSTSAKAIKGLALVAISNGTFTINSADDAIHSDSKIEISDGEFNISTADDGIRANTDVLISKGTINILKSYEGIEGKFITIENGDLNIVSSNDCLNATNGTRTGQNDGAILTINGGTMVLSGMSGDPLDSNGSIKQTGGTVIVHGPNSSPEVPIDYNGTYNMTRGFLIASAPGTQMLQATSTSSSQNCLKLVFGSQNVAETLVNIQDENGKNLATFKPLRRYIGILFSSPDIKTGSKYKISTGGNVTGSSIGGLYSGETYSNGTLRGTVSVSSSVTSMNNL